MSSESERVRCVRWVARRLFHVLRNFSRYIRIAVAGVGALSDVRGHNYARAEKGLLRVYELLPPGEEPALIVNLAMCLVSLRLGNPAAAAELSLKAIRQAKVPGAFIGASPAERDYLRYYGKLIYEEATRLDGTPMIMDVGIQTQADLDLDKVRARIRSDYPLSVVEPPGAHTLH